MMLRTPMTCSVASQHKMSPPMSAMAFRDATKMVMSNMAQQQPMMSTYDDSKNNDVNKSAKLPDDSKIPTSTDDQVHDAHSHQVTYCVDNEGPNYDTFFDEQENNQFMSNDEIEQINFENYSHNPDEF